MKISSAFVSTQSLDLKHGVKWAKDRSPTLFPSNRCHSGEKSLIEARPNRSQVGACISAYVVEKTSPSEVHTLHSRQKTCKCDLPRLSPFAKASQLFIEASLHMCTSLSRVQPQLIPSFHCRCDIAHTVAISHLRTWSQMWHSPHSSNISPTHLITTSAISVGSMLSLPVLLLICFILN